MLMGGLCSTGHACYVARQSITGGRLSTVPKKVDLLIVGAGLSGAVIAERCSKARINQNARTKIAR